MANVFVEYVKQHSKVSGHIGKSRLNQVLNGDLIGQSQPIEDWLHSVQFWRLA